MRALPAGRTSIAADHAWRAALATKFAGSHLAKSVYVIGFSYPVVPEGKARIRTQISSAHTREESYLRHGEVRGSQKGTRLVMREIGR